MGSTSFTVWNRRNLRNIEKTQNDKWTLEEPVEDVFQLIFCGH